VSGGAQVVAHRREHARAIVDQPADALAHVVERTGEAPDLGGTLLGKSRLGPRFRQHRLPPQSVAAAPSGARRPQRQYDDDDRSVDRMAMNQKDRAPPRPGRHLRQLDQERRAVLQPDREAAGASISRSGRARAPSSSGTYCTVGAGPELGREAPQDRILRDRQAAGGAAPAGTIRQLRIARRTASSISGRTSAVPPSSRGACRERENRSLGGACGGRGGRSTRTITAIIAWAATRATTTITAIWVPIVPGSRRASSIASCAAPHAGATSGVKT
jgi:hypothetical protein